MAVLRKEQIRNTGLRFKFQTLIQRFNTYQTYWMRISRQIEQGTYRRDVMRATARFGVDPTKERPIEAEDPPPRPRVDIPEADFEELIDGSEFLLPLEVEHDPFAAAVQAVPPPPLAGPPQIRERFASVVKLDLEELAAPFEEHDPFPKPPPDPAAPVAPKIRPRSALPQAPASEGELRDPDARVPLQSLRVAPRPGEASALQRPGTLPSVAVPPGVVVRSPTVVPAGAPTVSPPRVALQRPGTLPGAGPPPGASLQRPGTLPAGQAPPGLTAAPPARTIAPGPTIRGATVAPMGPGPIVRGATVAPTGPGAIVRGATVAPTGPGPIVRGATVAPTGPGPIVRGGTVAPTGPGPINRGATVAPTAQPQAKPAVSLPPAAARPAAAPTRAAVAPTIAPAAAAAPPAAPAPVGDLSGDRFGQIFSKYVETRREHNEPTHAITREALAKQLSESTQRLKQKHGGKPIDFEVVVKDGKTILRPVVK